MNLTSMAKYLEGKRMGIQGVSIFVNEMPLECKLGVLLFDRYSGTPIDHHLPGYRKTGFRGAFRSHDYPTCIDLASRVSKVLTIIPETPMDQMLVKTMLPQNDPRPYKRSKGGFWECEVEFDVVYVITP